MNLEMTGYLRNLERLDCVAFHDSGRLDSWTTDGFTAHLHPDISRLPSLAHHVPKVENDRIDGHHPIRRHY